MKPQTKDVHIYFPRTVLAAIKQLAAENRRSTSAEIVIAVEDYVKARQVVNGGRVKRGRE